MITYCSNCHTNWSSLHTVEGDGEETYDVCPLCCTDWYLQPGADIVGKLYCPIIGKISLAGVVEDQKQPSRERVVSRVLVWDEPIEDFIERRNKADDEWLENKLAGLPATMEKVERKYHYEEVIS